MNLNQILIAIISVLFIGVVGGFIVGHIMHYIQTRKEKNNENKR